MPRRNRPSQLLAIITAILAVLVAAAVVAWLRGRHTNRSNETPKCREFYVESRPNHLVLGWQTETRGRKPFGPVSVANDSDFSGTFLFPMLNHL